MAGKLTLRLKARNGQHVVNQLTSDSSIGELKATIASLTSISAESLRVLQGYPPMPLDLGMDNSKTLLVLGLRSGDTLIVEEDASIKAAKNVTHQENLLREINTQMQSSQGILMRHVVPANNSCLFTSVNYVMEGGAHVNLDSARPMRQLIVDIVSGDKNTYNEAFLGKSNVGYCKWIMDSESWGGAIEISILSQYYQVEIDIVDTQSGRIDRFGEDKNYNRRVLLIYDGIHYDPLKMEAYDQSSAVQTMFPSSDATVLAQAMELAQEAKASRQFTDVAKFTLRCLICNKNLTGQAEAQQHASQTGHINFGEV